MNRGSLFDQKISEPTTIIVCFVDLCNREILIFVSSLHLFFSELYFYNLQCWDNTGISIKFYFPIQFSYSTFKMHFVFYWGREWPHLEFFVPAINHVDLVVSMTWFITQHFIFIKYSLPVHTCTDTWALSGVCSAMIKPKLFG